MAVNLGKYPKYRQPPPTGKTTRIADRRDVPETPRAKDPSVAGGPTDIRPGMFGKDTAEAITGLGTWTTDIGITALEAEQKMEAKMRDDAEKNFKAKTLDKYEAELETLNKEFDWSKEYHGDQEAIDEFTNQFTAIQEKYAPLMDKASLTNKLEYDTKLYGTTIKQSLIGSEKQRVFITGENQRRVRNRFNKYYLESGGPELSKPDPTTGGYIPIIAQLGEDSRGSLTDKQLREEVEKHVTYAYQERVLFLSDIRKSGLLTDPSDEILALTERLRNQLPSALTDTVMKETSESVMAIRKALREQTIKGQETLAEKEKETRYLDRMAKLREDYPNRATDPAQEAAYYERKNEIRAAMGIDRVTPTKLAQEEILVGEGGKTTATGRPRPEKLSPGEVLTVDGKKVATGLPKITPLTDEGSYIEQNPDTGAVTHFTNAAPEVLRPGYIEEDGSFSVSGETEIRKKVDSMFGFETDPATGKPLRLDNATTKFHTKFLSDIAKKAMENKDGVYTYMSLSEALEAAFNEMDEKDIPKSFNMLEVANEIVKDVKNVSANTSTYSWGKAGHDKLVSEIREDVKKIEKIRLADGTGVFSGLTDMFGSLFGSFFETAVSPEVTVARFQYGLLVRDFVRKFTLSPRFAVKEQELLRAMFPGPGVFNAPPQAAAALREFSSELDRSIQENLDVVKLRGGASSKERLEALKDLRYIVGMKNRLDKFDLTGMESATEDRPVRITDIPTSVLVEKARNNPAFLARILGEHEAKKRARQSLPPLPDESAPVVELPTATTKKETAPPEEEDPNANLRETIQNINPDDIVSFANDFIKENSEDPAGAFIDVIKQIGESEIGDSILMEIRSLINSKPKKKKTSVKKKGKK